MKGKFRQLSELGAGEFEHIDGTLIDHLNGTRALLKSWGASAELQDAGLYHAAYGTTGFTERLVSTSQRQAIANIIGSEAENIVYIYCACERDYFWPQFGESAGLEYKNRFTGELCQLDQQQLHDFCELTVANELEIAQDNQDFIDSYGQDLYSLFTNMQPFLSSYANLSVNNVLAA